MPSSPVPAFALAAGLMWGLVFVAPLLLPQYPAALLTFGRYLAFGLIALPLAWLDRRRLAELQRADWIEALKLSAVGNLLYYMCLAAAIQRAGAPLPTMLIGTLPVVIAVFTNRRNAVRDGTLPWRKLLPSLLLIAVGIGCVNHVELRSIEPRSSAAMPAEHCLPWQRSRAGRGIRFATPIGCVRMPTGPAAPGPPPKA
jgi:drug/metabolite transporter (DMT)-like permease